MLSLLLPPLVVGAPAAAGDGVLEINQACAEQAGCFPGDAPGFPVTIDTAGSYRLTGILDVSFASPSPTAIEVVTSFVSIDLNGFGIVGSCGGPGCVGSSHGIDGGGSSSGPSRITVRNGFIRGMPGAGVQLGNSGRVEDLEAIANGGDGIGVQTASFVLRSRANGNGDDGIDVDDASVVSQCVAVGNGDDGIEAEGENIVIVHTAVSSNADLGIERQGRVSEQANACDDGSCSRQGVRRYYLSPLSFDGSQASGACDPGFHFASIFEIRDTGSLVYDRSRGAVVFFDQGQGPPATLGWVRTGTVDNGVSTIPGIRNCANWTTTTGAGTIALPGALDEHARWSKSLSPCDVGLRVWCVED